MVLKFKDETKKGLFFINLNNIIRSTGFSLIGVFIPVYLLTIGYALSEVFKYFLLFYISLFLFSIISMKLSKKYGIRGCFIINIIFLISYLIVLNGIKDVNNLIYFAALLAGVEGGFYWIPFGSFFAKITQNNKVGSRYGIFIVVGQVAGVIAPLIGAIFVDYWGFDALFYLAIVLFLLSLYPVLMLPNYKPDFKIRSMPLKKIYSNHKKFFWGSILMNIISEVEYIFWPIFIYLSFKSFIVLGAITTVVSLSTIVFIYILGKLSDKFKKSIFLRVAGLISVFVWISRIYFDSPGYLWVISIVAGFSMLLIEIPFQVLTFNKACKHEDSDEFVLFKEIPIFIGRLLIFLTVLFFINQFEIAFIIAAVASFIMVLLDLKE